MYDPAGAPFRSSITVTRTNLLQGQRTVWQNYPNPIISEGLLICIVVVITYHPIKSIVADRLQPKFLSEYLAVRAVLQDAA